MKRFIDEHGTFEIKVPDTWRYSLKNGKIHTFQEYELWKSDAFQLSIGEPKNKDETAKFHGISKTLDKTEIKGITYYSFPERKSDGFTTKTWTKLIDGKIILFTLTHAIHQDKDLDPTNISDKLKVVHEIISEFRLIKPSESEQEINTYRFEMFLQGVGAAVYMLNKAIANQSFIEATCLLASQIDGLLRIGIVLQKQINNNNSDIEKEWIYQGATDRKKSEKDIYKKAKELGIISEQVFDDLYELYDDRNRVIHRFIISEITVAEVEEIAYKYSQMMQEINSVIFDIEKEQIELGVGMTKKGVKSEDNHLDFIKGKVGKQNFFDEKK